MSEQTTATEKYWLLPDGISESLPTEAEHLDYVSRCLMDHFKTWGYRQVMPPMIEFLESLQTGTGALMNGQLFKVTDHISGRMLGIRADITPQVARIDAHSMNQYLPNRLCYVGPVLRSRSSNLLEGNRSPIQIGAELFGHSGIESDFEILQLMLAILRQCYQGHLLLSMGHIGVYRRLIELSKLSGSEQEAYRSMLVRRSMPEIEEWLSLRVASGALDTLEADRLRCLPDLNGDPSDVIAQARLRLCQCHDDILHDELNHLEQLIERLANEDSSVSYYLDLAELRGYAYHTGIVFEAYLEDGKRDIARGGRYDGIGRLFGNDRPATGFSADLRLIAGLESLVVSEPNYIYAPSEISEELDSYIKTLRTQGECVIRALGENDYHNAYKLGCRRKLVQQNGVWELVTLKLETSE